MRSTPFRFIALSLVLIGLGILQGCLAVDEFFSEIEISRFDVDPETLAHGSSGQVRGWIESDTALLSLDFFVFDEDGITELVNIATVSQVPVSGKSVDLEKSGTTIKISEAACAGHYLLKMTVRDKVGDQRSLMAPFAVTNPNCNYGKPDTGGNIHTGNEMGKVQVTLGSSGNPAPGSVDLDDFTTYAHAAAKAKSAQIDLYYGQNPNDLSDRLFPPSEAKSLQIGAQSSGPATWNSANATQLRQLVFTKSQFESIGNQAEIDALWSRGTSVSSALVVVGNVYLAKTNQGKTVVLRVSALVAGSKGSLTLDSYK